MSAGFFLFLSSALHYPNWPVVSLPEESDCTIHQHPAPEGNFQYAHRVEKNFICFALCPERIVVQPVEDNCRFGITFVRREYGPENMWYSGKCL